MGFKQALSLPCPDVASLLGTGQADVQQRFRVPKKHVQILGQDVTLLHIAAWKGDAETIKLLLDSGSDPNAVSSLLDKTALHLVPFDAPAECLIFLLDAGAEIKRDAQGLTFFETISVEASCRKQNVKKKGDKKGTTEGLTTSSLLPATLSFGEMTIKIAPLFEAEMPSKIAKTGDRFSISTALAMVMLSNSSYCSTSDLEDRVLSTMIRRWGFNNFVLLKSKDNVGCVVDKDNDSFVSFRGTKTFDNILTDLNAQEEQGFHRGFYLALDSIWNDLIAVLGLEKPDP